MQLSDLPPGLREQAERKLREQPRASTWAQALHAPVEPAPKRKRGQRGPDKKPRAVRKQERSRIEVALELQLKAKRFPKPATEFHFLEDRNFRFDFAWPDRKIAVEVQGTQHRIRDRFHADIEKRALALLAGWRVLEVSGRAVRDGRAIQWLRTLMRSGKEQDGGEACTP